MSYNIDKQLVTAVLGQYARVLNSGKSASVADFYTDDAYFLPEGVKVPLYKQHLKKSGSTHLKQNAFSIQYDVKDVVVDNDYAFVEATATTSQKSTEDALSVTKTSTDLFVLKKIEGNWKIYRYIFNNVTILYK